MEFDVLIAGAGPAGSSSALFLAKKGYNVAVFDKAKFPREKVCGDGLSGKTLKLLKELNISELDKNIAMFADGVIFSSPNREILEVEIPKEKLNEVHGYVSRREDFDNVLFNEVKKQCTAFENAKVLDIIKDKNDHVKGLKVDINGQIKEVNANVVIGADGANSIVATKTNAEKIVDEHVFVAVRAYYENVDGMKNKIELHFTEDVLPGYFWIFPLPNKKANVGIGMLLSDLKKTRKDL
ncbi:MAG: geranylgeranyl reductase family protein, partial [Candidatus Anstonellales archaeon]